MDNKTRYHYTFFLDSVPPFSDKMDLIGMFNLLEELGNFHEELSVIHIAGTNGKGSCTIMLDSIYRANGYSCATYTSPYIDDYRECIHINGSMISVKAMNNATQEIQIAYERLQSNEKQLPTQYECLTAIAFYSMYKANVNLAIIETLMGGRDDATNVFKNIEAALITSISYDHTEFLGPSLMDITMHKAGIIQANCPVFINPNKIEVIEAICSYATTLNAPCYVSKDYLNTSSIGLMEYLPLPLNGSHQVDNFFGVLSIITYLNKRYPLLSQNTRIGLSKLHYPCRIETFEQNGHTITLDGSHNEDGLTALYQHLLAQKTRSSVPIILVFGSLKGKNYQRGLSLLASLASEIILTTPNSPRALEANLYNSQDYTTISNLDECILYIKNRLKKRTTPLHFVICGSFYIAYPFRRALINH
jgi:dihydrofolate synthase/folylpolyglutamate synthase